MWGPTSRLRNVAAKNVAGETMHHLDNVEFLARTNGRRTIAMFGVVGGIYSAYKMTQHFRSKAPVPMRSSVPPTSLWWSGQMSLLFRMLSPADKSKRALGGEPCALMSTTGTGDQCQQVSQTAFGESLAGAASGTRSSNFPRPPARFGEHTQWLESFRTEQTRRLKSDPPID